MLPSTYNVDKRRRFLNISTGQCIFVGIPDLRRYYYFLGPTAEGLLLLCRKVTHIVQLLNPLTGQVTDLPRATSMMPPTLSRKTTAYRLRSFFCLHSAGVADDSTVALLHNYRFLAVAKPGDERWTRFTFGPYSNMRTLVLPFAGRLYCVTHESILVVEATAPPRLVAVADYQLLEGAAPPSYDDDDWTYPVYNDDGNLILVHRNTSGDHYSSEKYTTYRVNLDTGNVVRMSGLGGQALFLALDSWGRSWSVSPEVSSSISNDTIYVCNNVPDQNRPGVVAFDLLDGSVVEPNFDKKDIIYWLVMELRVLVKSKQYTTYSTILPP
jgi:hypothetical protein